MRVGQAFIIVATVAYVGQACLYFINGTPSLGVVMLAYCVANVGIMWSNQ